MSSAVEEAIKVLAEFESELEEIREESVDARKRLSKIAKDEGDKAMKLALARAHAIAEEQIRKAREDAEREADSISKKGEEALAGLKEKISKRSEEALRLVSEHLLGD
jgi:vacuolar-type H+-ATPase subunit H